MAKDFLKIIKKKQGLVFLFVISILLGIYILYSLNLTPEPINNLLSRYIPNPIQRQTDNFTINTSGGFQDAYSKSFDILIGNSDTLDARWYKILEVDNMIIKNSRVRFSLQLDIYPSPGGVSHQKFLLSVRESVTLDSPRFQKFVRARNNSDGENENLDSDDIPVVIRRSDIITGFNDAYYATDPKDVNSDNILSFMDIDFDEMVLYSSKRNGTDMYELWIHTTKKGVANVPASMTIKHISNTLQEDNREFRVNVSGDNVALEENLTTDTDNRKILKLTELRQDGVPIYGSFNVEKLRKEIECKLYNKGKNC